ncbi:hypothetical protein [Streptomyces halobius]|uniref:Uncharacterized protein n=1 Tax=Streptomyces halobius TaxID=2879846 RepID=A0ABY4LZZ7_9ACTN|nr:hypothetical protein [Streptomyces halobius]UQA90767.1 hypothetical protein K9S39_01685 [Streptomyces halobius]
MAREVKTWATLRLRVEKTTATGTRPATVPGVLADLALEPQSGALPEIRGTRTHMFLQEGDHPFSGRQQLCQDRITILVPDGSIQP